MARSRVKYSKPLSGMIEVPPQRPVVPQKPTSQMASTTEHSRNLWKDFRSSEQQSAEDHSSGRPHFPPLREPQVPTVLESSDATDKQGADTFRHETSHHVEQLRDSQTFEAELNKTLQQKHDLKVGSALDIYTKEVCDTSEPETGSDTSTIRPNAPENPSYGPRKSSGAHYQSRQKTSIHNSVVPRQPKQPPRVDAVERGKPTRPSTNSRSTSSDCDTVDGGHESTFGSLPPVHFSSSTYSAQTQNARTYKQSLETRNSKIALIVHWPQKGFMYCFPHNKLRALENFIDSAHKAGVPVIYNIMKMGDEIDHALPTNQFVTMYKGVSGAAMVFQELLPDLDPRKYRAIVHPTTRIGAFSQGNLAKTLTSWGVDTLVLTGATSETSVLSTYTAACQMDFRVLIIDNLCVDGGEPDTAEKTHVSLMTDIFPRQAKVTTSAFWLQNQLWEQKRLEDWINKPA